MLQWGDLFIFMPVFSFSLATGVACKQGTLTLPDTWFRPPFWDLLMLQLLRPNSSTLTCLYSTFHLEYPLVLSRFCLDIRDDRALCKSPCQSYPWVKIDDFTKYHRAINVLYVHLLYFMLISSNLNGQMARLQFSISHGNVTQYVSVII